MKKFTIIIFFIAIFCANIKFKPTIASAENYEYFRVLNDGVYIYQDSFCTQKIFEVPKTYYVKIENLTQEFARVSYGYENNGYPVIIGYMKLSEITSSKITPTNPFNLIKVSTNLSDVLFNDATLKNAYFNVSNNTFMTYYGSYTTESGSKLCYVYCNNKLGYIDLNSLNPFSMPQNTDPIETENPKQEDNEQETLEPEDNSPPSSLKGEGLQIIIIVGISIICISIVYTLFKPTKNKVYKREQTDFTDEE